MEIGNDKSDEVLLAVARIIWDKEITIGDFYETLGMSLGDSPSPAFDNAVERIIGILAGWNNPIDGS